MLNLAEAEGFELVAIQGGEIPDAFMVDQLIGSNVAIGLETAFLGVIKADPFSVIDGLL